jgi:6-phosphogluconolactonase/glucosamine-6-phosphate isomerase/deaminase
VRPCHDGNPRVARNPRMGWRETLGCMEVRVEADPAGWAAGSIARRLRAAVGRGGRACLAVSGGSTALPMLDALAAQDLAWGAVEVWQVDERVAPDRDPDRNANQLAGFPGSLHLMPVTAKDLRRAAARYAATLPPRFDVIHLGMGPDGHTASWPPGDPVIDSARPVDLCGEFNGRVRMTLTPPVVDAARSRIVLITGGDKASVVAAWLKRHPLAARFPVSRVRHSGTVVVLDAAAASQLDR